MLWRKRKREHRRKVRLTDSSVIGCGWYGAHRTDRGAAKGILPSATKRRGLSGRETQHLGNAQPASNDGTTTPPGRIDAWQKAEGQRAQAAYAPVKISESGKMGGRECRCASMEATTAGDQKVGPVAGAGSVGDPLHYSVIP